MPLDPTLVRGLTPISVPQPDPNAGMNQLAMVMKLQGLQNEMQTNQLQAQKYRQEANSAAALAAARAAYDPKNPASEQALFAAGGGADLQSMRAAEKTRADTIKIQRDDALNTFRNLVLPGLTPDNPEGIRQAYGALASNPLFNLFDNLPPGAVMRAVDVAMSKPGGAEKVLFQLQGLTPDKLAQMDTDRANVNLRAGELGVSQRQVAVAEDRARREAFDSLSAEAEAGKAAAKGTNVSEETAAYHVNNLVDNANLIGEALAKEPGAVKPGMLEAAVTNTVGLGGLTGATQSAQRQIVDQSNKQILDSVLYLATGAAYNKEQRTQAVESLVPKYFDTPEALAAQKRRLLSLIEGGKIRADSAWTPELEKTARRAIDNMYTPAGGAAPRTPAARTAEDEEMLNWARQQPADDPQAREILRLNGM